MKKIFSCILLFSSITFFSCTKSYTGEAEIWVLKNYENDVLVYERAPSINTNSPAWQFNEDGTMLDRKNSGWCGTPPVTYENYPGTWQLLHSGSRLVKTRFWGGEQTYRIDIISKTADVMKVKVGY